jgi:hypothetical protein
MKLIYALLYFMYNILLFTIAATLLISIVIIAATNSWYYLFLYFPVLLYIYQSEAINFRKKRHTRTGKRS